jgi:hypothetical protein
MGFGTKNVLAKTSSSLPASQPMKAVERELRTSCKMVESHYQAMPSEDIAD